MKPKIRLSLDEFKKYIQLSEEYIRRTWNYNYDKTSRYGKALNKELLEKTVSFAKLMDPWKDKR